jgi:hypothetical protein
VRPWQWRQGARGKPVNLITAAIAREMLAFAVV